MKRMSEKKRGIKVWCGSSTGGWWGFIYVGDADWVLPPLTEFQFGCLKENTK